MYVRCLGEGLADNLEEDLADSLEEDLADNLVEDLVDSQEEGLVGNQEEVLVDSLEVGQPDMAAEGMAVAEDMAAEDKELDHLQNHNPQVLPEHQPKP